MVLDLIEASAARAEPYRNECVRMFESAGWPDPQSEAPPGFDAKQAIRACRRIVERFPEELLIRHFLADAHWFAGEREAAVRVLARSATRFGSFGLSSLLQDADALALLKTQAEKDDEAQVALAHLYKEGRGVPADPDLASALFRRAAEQGNPEGQYQVGRALWWAALNDPESAMANAWRSEAEPWLRKAAAQCHLEAQGIIDGHYDNVGYRQTLKNETLIKARRGDALAQRELAADYFSGRLFGGPPSDKDAYAWITIALEWGSPAPEELRRWERVLIWRMSHDQMAEAKALTAVLRRSLCVD